MGCNLKSWWFLTTTTFTAMMLSFCAFALLDGLTLADGLAAMHNSAFTPELSWHMIWQGFVLCGSLSLLQLLWSRVSPFTRLKPRLELLLDALCRCLLCLVVVYAEGILFRFFPAGWASLWMIVPVLIPIFFATYAITYFTYLRAKRDADFINQKIGGKKDRGV